MLTFFIGLQRKRATRLLLLFLMETHSTMLMAIHSRECGLTVTFNLNFLIHLLKLLFWSRMKFLSRILMLTIWWRQYLKLWNFIWVRANLINIGFVNKRSIFVSAFYMVSILQERFDRIFHPACSSNERRYSEHSIKGVFLTILKHILKLAEKLL